jgi:hypothetical protein
VFASCLEEKWQEGYVHQVRIHSCIEILERPAPAYQFNEDKDDLGTDEDKDGELPEHKRKHLVALENKLMSCAWCGPNSSFCKINKSSTHVNLTMNQRRAWENALVIFLPCVFHICSY